MTDYENPSEKRIGDDCLGTRDVPRLGTDQTGAVHYYDDRADRILVAREGDIEHVEPLDGRPVSDWMAYVGDRRGWRLRGAEGWFADLRAIAEASDV